MEVLSKRAISEVLDVLKHTDTEITEKIPEKFIKFLFENKDSEYKSNIDFYNDNWDDTVEEDTKTILAIIYRDYIVSENERNELLKQESKEKIKKEEELREKYNPDDLFKNKNSKVEKVEESIAMVEYKETIFTKIKNWLKRLF